VHSDSNVIIVNVFFESGWASKVVAEARKCHSSTQHTVVFGINIVSVLRETSI
jgi:hypothetical protein